MAVLQRGQPLGPAEAAWAQEQKLIATVLDAGNAVGAIDIASPLTGDFVEIADALGKTHGADSLSWRGRRHCPTNGTRIATARCQQPRNPCMADCSNSRVSWVS